MTEIDHPGGVRLTRQRWAPPSPSLAVLPGTVLLALGLGVVTGGGSLTLGWIFFAVGSALLLVGGVAMGVAWGLALHAEDRR